MLEEYDFSKGIQGKYAKRYQEGANVRILDTKREISKAQSEFKHSLDTYPSEAIKVQIGYQGGSHRVFVKWIDKLGLWARFGFTPTKKSKRKRYWNVFGIGRPSGLVSIVCEINPPIDGINRKVYGAFSKDTEGNTIVLHRGKFHVHGGMKKEFFRREYRGSWIEVVDGDRIASVVRVGAISNRNFGNQLREFILEIMRIKNLARSN
jgi:hypothetical protein